MRILLALLLLSFIGSSYAEENICPTSSNESWDKMKESSFSKESLQKTLVNLQKLFNGEIKVADEFVWQSQLVIEGAYLRMEVDTWKHDPKNYKYAYDRFCKFMSEHAYLVH